MSARKKEEINLLPQKGFEMTTVGRVLSWILSSFRIIVIATEIIVMIAFLSRFWLDAQNTDLNEEIEDKKAVLSASLAFEKEFKDIQNRIEIFSNISSQAKVSEQLEVITKLLPPDIFLENINFSGQNKNIIVGLSANEVSVQQFIVNLKSSDIFENVSLGKLSSYKNNSELIEFEIELQRKEATKT